MAWSKNKNNIAFQATGTFTANGTTGVVFAPTVPLNPNSTIVVNYVSGTATGHPFVTARTNGAVGTASLTFTSVASNAAVYTVTILG